jgi:hypothetical protein
LCVELVCVASWLLETLLKQSDAFADGVKDLEIE